ncbi:hypothetical protein PFISCL1PPCAC_12857, partial [Pristionchus fissidentatus]
LQVGVNAESLDEARTICRSFGADVASVHNAQENSFIRRLAVSKGLVNGIRLGAIADQSSSYAFHWLDRTQWNYANFQPGFPMAGLGNCLAMTTNNAGGQWINVDCTAEIPYACARNPNYNAPACGTTIIKEGDIIYSPGFPDSASQPCDYYLKVDPNKRVEAELLFLEANSCCDQLVLFEGSIGGTVIANLTGEMGATRTFSTKSSNLMRVSWQPNGGLNVRGMM